MQKKIFVFFLVFFIISCQEKKAQNELKDINVFTKKDMHKDSVAHYTKKMEIIRSSRFAIMEDYGEDDFNLEFLNDPQFSHYTAENINELLSLIAIDLKSNNYKLPLKTDFYNKIDSIFGFKLSTNNKYLRKYDEFTFVLRNTPSANFKNYPMDFEFEESNLTISTKYGFVILTNYWYGNYEPNEEYSSGTNLYPNIVHLNKYLFNNSKSSYTWLSINDSTLLEDLFIIYGYTADKKLDKWILDKRADNDATSIDHDPYDFGKLFYHIWFDNTAKLNNEVFEVFEEEPSAFYMDQLGFLFAKLGSNVVYDFADDLPFELRAELYAKLMYHAENVAEKNKDIEVKPRDYMNYPSCFGDYKGIFMEGFKKNGPESSKYYNEFKRNNFYNLPNFEYYWNRNEGFSQAILLFT